MPIRRMLGKRKRAANPFRRRLRRRRALIRRRIPRGIRSRVYAFKRYTAGLTFGNASLSAGLSQSYPSTNVALFTFSAATPSAYYYSGANAFALQDIPNYSELTQLYDRYKLNCVVLKMFPFSNDPSTSNTTASSGGLGCLMHSVLDYDDYTQAVANDGGIDTLRQYQNYRCTNMAQKRVWKRVIRPKMLVGVNNPAGAIVGNSVTRPRYIDCANTAVPHLGHKYILEFYSPTAASTTYTIKWEYTYYFTLRDVR